MCRINAKWRKLLCQLLSVLLLCQFAGAFAATGDGEPFPEVFNKISDPDTSNVIDYMGQSTLENGRIWTDKTVNASRAEIFDAAGKPVNSISAAADEFLVTLSALSQGYTIETIVEPTDTVFVLDISGSMYMYTVGDTGRTRLDVMVDALNEAIGILMEANQNNRIAVVAFGGQVVGSINGSKICPILKLSHYKVNDDKYFSVKGTNQVTVSSQIPDSALLLAANRTITAGGGTPTQRGIYAGAKILLGNTDTDFTATDRKGNNYTVKRKPNIILLTDGEPTLGYTDYTLAGMNTSVSPGVAFDSDSGHDSGNGAGVDLGIDMLTVLTAAYYKQRVHDWYYGAADTEKSVGFYTIGLDVSGFDAAAVLDPAGSAAPPQTNAGNVAQALSGKTYNMKSLLDSFVSLTGTGSVTYPVLNRDSSTARVTKQLQNSGGYVKNYDYTDGYYPATTVAEVSGAFMNIAQQIVSNGSYTTEADENDPDFDGYLVFSDVIGEYMEFKSLKGLVFNNNLYSGQNFARDASANPATRSAYAKVMVKHQDDKMTEAAALLLINSCVAAGKERGGLYYVSSSDFSNKIKYYADSERNYKGSYFEANGELAAKPPGATCVVDLYAVEGATVNSVTGAPTDLLDIAFHVVTALEDGDFECVFSDGIDLVRHLKAGQQVVRWYTPASLIPQRTVTEKHEDDDPGLPVTEVLVKESVPIRFLYSVGLSDSLVLPEIDAQYKDDNGASGKDAYYFYTNSFKDAANASMAFFQPALTNQYYFYTEEDAGVGTPGIVPLYYLNGGSYVLETGSYTDGRDYYTRSVCFDVKAAGIGYAQEEYAKVDEDITAIEKGAGAPYISVGTVKKEAALSMPKNENRTETKGYIVANSSHKINGVPVQYHVLDNNGRLEVPFTKVAANKTWDGNEYEFGDETYPMDIKSEYLQLYANGTAVGTPIEMVPVQQGVNSYDSHEWADLPKFELKADANGNAVFITHTVKEGTLDGGVFKPYERGDSGAGDSAPCPDDMNILYFQPAWDDAADVWGDADIFNLFYLGGTGYGNLTIFKDIDVSKAPGLDPLDMKIDFEVTFDKGEKVNGFWPDNFDVTTGSHGYMIGAGMHPYFAPITIRETSNVPGYKNTITIDDITCSSDPPSGPTFLEGYPDQPDPNPDNNVVFDADVSFPSDCDVMIVLEPLVFGSDVTIRLRNSYEPIDSPTLTLKKDYTGSIGQDDHHDITFVVEGWEDPAHTKRIFYDTTHCHYIKSNGGLIEFPIQPNDDGSWPDGQPHPQLLPKGHYTITEFGAENAVSSSDPYGCVNDVVLSAAVDSSMVTVSDNNTVSFQLGEGEDVTVEMTNAFVRRAALVLKKAFAPEGLARMPIDLVFKISGPDGYLRYVGYDEFIDGQFVINDLLPGMYTVQEENGSLPGYDVEVSPSDLPTVSLDYGDHKDVNFTNEYSMLINPQLASLTIEKVFSGIEEEMQPSDIVFTVTGVGNPFMETVKYVDFSNELGTGKHTIHDLEPGTYKVTESGGSVSGVYLYMNHPSGYSVNLDYGESETVVFENTYSTTPPEQPEQRGPSEGGDRYRPPVASVPPDESNVGDNATPPDEAASPDTANQDDTINVGDSMNPGAGTDPPEGGESGIPKTGADAATGLYVCLALLALAVMMLMLRFTRYRCIN
ncbi:MAG: hypothetical protein FWG42_04275 [Clostridiales bacterium]|nr:hypothetical protein [Clostridiales bacterium]